MGMILVPISSISASATILYILVSISSIKCEFRPEQKIIGGTFAQAGEFPHQVAVFIRGSTGVELCGGSILARDYILIAGHCVAKKDPGNAKIVAGKHDITGRDRNPGVFAEHVVIHPCYNQSSNSSMGSIYLNDIAIIKLKGCLTMGCNVKKIKIDDKDLAQDGKTVQVIGWGRTHETDSSGKYSPRLKKAKLTLNITGWRNNNFLYASLYEEGQILGFNPGEFACAGDSGGPLLCDDGTGRKTNVVCGITSFAATTNIFIGPCHGPSIYTRVFHYRNWINDVLNGDYDSDKGCIGERYLPLPPRHSNLSRRLTPSPTCPQSSSFSRPMPTTFILYGICFTMIFLSAWGNKFF